LPIEKPYKKRTGGGVGDFKLRLRKLESKIPTAHHSTCKYGSDALDHPAENNVESSRGKVGRSYSGVRIAPVLTENSPAKVKHQPQFHAWQPHPLGVRYTN
jgi:hypothetical protein